MVAAAKHAGLYTEALALAASTPCNPMTLARAARDFAEEQPAFAIEAGLLAIHWLVQGYGYEITMTDVHEARQATLHAAAYHGNVDAVAQRVSAIVTAGGTGATFVAATLQSHTVAANRLASPPLNVTRKLRR